MMIWQMILPEIPRLLLGATGLKKTVNLQLTVTEISKDLGLC